MGHYILKNLGSQQKALASSDYDLRVTNLARFIYRKLPVKSGRLIDIGCGNGLQLRFFKNKGFNVSGMELSPTLCEAMRENPKMKGINVFVGDISEEKGSEEFDVVLATDVIEHIQNDEKTLKNLYSFVAPGGMLIISVPAHSYLFGKRDKLWGHYRRYDRKLLLNKLASLKGQAIFSSYWNFTGFFAYFFFERILNKPIRENFRYNANPLSKLFRGFLDFLLRIEQLLGYSPVGLSLVIGLRKPFLPTASRT